MVAVDDTGIDQLAVNTTIFPGPGIFEQCIGRGGADCIIKMRGGRG